MRYIFSDTAKICPCIGCEKREDICKKKGTSACAPWMEYEAHKKAVYKNRLENVNKNDDLNGVRLRAVERSLKRIGRKLT